MAALASEHNILTALPCAYYRLATYNQVSATVPREVETGTDPLTVPAIRWPPKAGWFIGFLTFA
jgi:hypothetical protein